VKVLDNSAEGLSTVSLKACAVNCKPLDNHNKPCVAVLDFFSASSFKTKSCKVDDLSGVANKRVRILETLPDKSF